MIRILIISDVHGNIKLMDKILKENKKCNYSFFLGDFELFSKQKHILQVNKFDKVVTGNCDISNISPTHDFFEFGGIKILLTHGHRFSSFSKKI